jgi:hypothetical protein
VPDLLALLVGAARSIEFANWDPAAAERILTVIFAGLATDQG